MAIEASQDQGQDELYSKLHLGNKQCSIRLLYILAGGIDDPIRCKMVRTTLLDSPSYEALSYTWGLSAERLMIHVNDVAMPVTVNLWLALRHLRRARGMRTVWIDALCINQHDLAERSAQVQEMGNVYHSADRVLIWLGPMADDYNVAAEYIRNTVTQVAHNWSKVRGGEQGAEPGLAAVGRLLTHAWWERVWVVQEVSRARRDPLIIVGPEQYLSWADIKVFSQSHHYEYLRRNRNASSNLLQLVSIRDRTRTPPRLRDLDHEETRVDVRNDEDSTVDEARRVFAQDLSYLLNTTHTFQSSDPRDKLFALWTLVRGSDGGRLKPDYTKTMSEVYTAVTREIFQMTGSVEILDCRWGVPSDELYLRHLDSFYLWTCRTAGDSPFVHGIKLDHISQVLTIGEIRRLAERQRNDNTSKSTRREGIAAEERLLLTYNTLAFRSRVAMLKRVDVAATAVELKTFKLDQARIIPLVVMFARWLISTSKLLVRDSAGLESNVASAASPDDLMMSLVAVIPVLSAAINLCKHGLPEQMSIDALRAIDEIKKHQDRKGEEILYHPRSLLPFITSWGHVGVGPGHLLPNDDLVLLQGMQSVSAVRIASSRQVKTTIGHDFEAAHREHEASYQSHEVTYEEHDATYHGSVVLRGFISKLDHYTITTGLPDLVSVPGLSGTVTGPMRPDV